MLTTPVIRCLKQQTGAEVHFLTKKNFQNTLAANPYIDKIISFDKDINAVINELKKENYDFIIDLHHNIRSKFIKLKLGKPGSAFIKLNIEKWLVVNLKINRLPDNHIVDRYMKAVEPLGVVNDNKGLDYFIPREDEVGLSQLPEFHQKGYVGVVIGGQHATKRLPVEKIISICRKINFPIVLLGGPGDKISGDKIASLVSREKVYNSCGKYSLNQSASLVRQAKKIITHDTGLMHIAAAFKKDIISIWGNTIPEFGMYPYMAGENSKIVEVKELPCRPCSKIGFDKCPKKHFYCMQLIEESLILNSFEK